MARPKPDSNATMRTTTLRFSEDLWALLEIEAARAGTSVSQYVREAALARVAASAGARGDLPFAALANASRQAAEDGPLRHRAAIERALSQLARALTGEHRTDHSALTEQARQTLRHARRLHDERDDDGAG